ncbi:MAG: diguanylate cyclase [Eubacterium sp.]|nr:diguanylate cyclase [Eubacterium sp.]
MFISIVAVMGVAMIIGVVSISKLGSSDAEQTLLLVCDAEQKDLNTLFTNAEESVDKVAGFIESDLRKSEYSSLSDGIKTTKDYFADLVNGKAGILSYYYYIDPEASGSDRGFWYVNPDGEGFKKYKISKITLHDKDGSPASDWFTVPKETGEPAWIPPYMSGALDTCVISYNVPIYWRGHFLGVVGVEMDYNAIADRLQNISLYDHGYSFILDPMGNIFYHPQIDVKKKGYQEQIADIQDALLSDEQFVIYKFDGVEKKAVWLSLSNEMRLYITVPASEMNARWQKWVHLIIIVSFALLVFVIALFAYLRYILHTSKDVEEEKQRLEKELQSAAELTELMSSMSTLMTNIPAMSFSKDVLTGVYLACNQFFAEYAGKSDPSEVVGLKDFDIFDPVTAAHFVEDDHKTLIRNEAYVFFEDETDATGNVIRNLQISKKKFRDASGRLCILGLGVDVTETTKAKAEEAANQVRIQGEEEKQALKERYKENVKRLSYKALHDELTGVYNRTAYDMRVKKMDFSTTCLLMADADDFKQINDTYGHETGDRVLIRIADTLKKHFRADDRICRVGGDEFVVLMHHIQKEHSMLIESKIKRINEDLSTWVDDIPPISVSVGYAHGSDVSEPDPAALMKLADQAMYKSKREKK